MLTFSLILMIFIIIPFLFILINLSVSSKKMKDREKLSPFECGFDPLSSSRLPFSMQFYLISIIFLIFDIEIIIFLPIIPSFFTNMLLNWMETSLIFILILTLGLYIEWMNGALSWLK
uniref:NADH dehydrogenase subunit 3 n=1 Tax=Gotra octocincta TaxID=3029099 RepID=UPI0023D83BB3|nr:NADH dehydrogenase subunit 3 [Gotra octocincta]WDQ40357.1 NADH dehydrogenase subunit 3 [Gotra octocincta]